MYQYIIGFAIILLMVIRLNALPSELVNIAKDPINTNDIKIELIEKTEARKVYDPRKEKYYDINEFNALGANELTHFKGIGPALADAIINYIQDNGPLKSFDDLLNIKGIGSKKLENILDNSK